MRNGIVQEFYDQTILPKSITSSFLALILKNANHQCLEDFKCILLIRSLYKIISKILASKLKLVINELISSCQSTFIQGRKMLDEVLVIKDILDFTKRSKRECMFVKLEFEKAYDRVSWDLLRCILRRMDIGFKWMPWMEATIIFISMSVLVNESPT